MPGFSVLQSGLPHEVGTQISSEGGAMLAGGRDAGKRPGSLHAM